MPKTPLHCHNGVVDHLEQRYFWVCENPTALSNFAMGTILGKGFAQAQVHTEFIAQVPKAWVLWTVYTTACEKPFPKIIIPMTKLHSLIVLAIAFYMGELHDNTASSGTITKKQKYVVCTYYLSLK